MDYRVEKDALGEVKVPIDAYYGSFTVRALANFNISGLTPSSFFKRALSTVKRASAMTNAELGLLTPEQLEAIVQAIDDFDSGRFDEEFVLDYFQAGAGTPFNMNFNEIIANRANEILGSGKGKYEFIHPNNHINMGQSSNDVIPTAIRIAAMLYFKEELMPAVLRLCTALNAKGEEGSRILKVGRTHLQDAVPLTVKQEFRAWSRMLEKSLNFARKTLYECQELGIGGTALGSGITAAPSYSNLIIKHLSFLTGIDELCTSSNFFDMSQSCDALLSYSSGLRQIAINLMKISSDLMLLNTGPGSGYGELSLPEVEPGSSIMPGKVNPSVCEAVYMTACQVLGNDDAVSRGAAAGHLQLNVMTPMILFNLEFSASLLKKVIDCFVDDCIADIRINEDVIRSNLNSSLVFATALVPYLGYQVVAELVKEALVDKSTIVDVVKKHNLMLEDELEAVLDPEFITAPVEIDISLRDAIKLRESYKNFLHLIKK